MSPLMRVILVTFNESDFIPLTGGTNDEADRLYLRTNPS